MDTSMSATVEGREYIQTHRLWHWGEILTMRVMTERPDRVEAFFAHVLEQEQSTPTTDVPPPRPEMAITGKQYLLEKRVAYIIESWFRELLKVRPPNPLAFSVEYFRSKTLGPDKLSEHTPRSKILILAYSSFGHIYPLTKAAADGVLGVGHFVEIKRIPEIFSPETQKRLGVVHSALPIASVGDLAFYDGFIFAFPTRFGTAPAQVNAFIDQTGPLWLSGVLTGKPAAVLTSSATQHGGQETTIRNFHSFLLHQGCVVVGVPPSSVLDDPEDTLDLNTIEGGSFYGASTIVGGRGEREASPRELRIAQSLGRHLARIASMLHASI